MTLKSYLNIISEKFIMLLRVSYRLVFQSKVLDIAPLDQMHVYYHIPQVKYHVNACFVQAKVLGFNRERSSLMFMQTVCAQIQPQHCARIEHSQTRPSLLGWPQSCSPNNTHRLHVEVSWSLCQLMSESTNSVIIQWSQITVTCRRTAPFGTSPVIITAKPVLSACLTLHVCDAGLRMCDPVPIKVRTYHGRFLQVSVA